MVQNITLNGTKIKTSPDFEIQRYNITNSQRLSSGKMTMELIAKKRKFICKWASMAASDLNVILDIIWEGSALFFTLGYVENNVDKTAQVYVGDINTALFRTDAADWIWKDVELHFIEQ